MSLSRRTIRRIVLPSRPCASVRSHSQQNIYSQLEQSSFNTQQPQLVAEERQDNAVFKIYFKRIQHKSSSTLDKTNTTRGELLYSTVKIYQLKAGTLEKIVECLTDKYGELDATHMQILFATYRTFTNTQLLIETILNRYNDVLPASLDMIEDIRQKTLRSLSSALACFLTSYKEDFYDPPSYSILVYIQKHSSDRDIQNQSRSLMNRFLHEGDTILRNDFEFVVVDDNNNHHHHHQSKLPSTDMFIFDYHHQMNFYDLSEVILAEQLTIIDADLLKRVLPHECLTMGGNGSKFRNGNTIRELSTVDKTIEQFNAVVKRVIATVLLEHNDQLRARIMEKWIDIAYQCRQLKNFSSLTAILNGLLSGCIFRLKTAWSYLDRNHITILNTLKDVFGSCADRKQARAILDKQLDEIRLILPECNEGTAKYVIPMNGTIGKKNRPKKDRIQQKIVMGTVPYLGLYLSDLTYLDSAYDNTINLTDTNQSTIKLINFEKHRKQFEILAQIKLFQSAANAYTTLHRLDSFRNWFDRIETYDEEQSWKRSFEIEPNDNSPRQQQKYLDDPISSSNRTKPLKAFASQVSFESITPPVQHHLEPVVPNSLHSTPSLTSLDKLSLNSVQSYPQQQQQSSKRMTQKAHSRSASISSFSTNASSSQGYMSAQASPATSIANCTMNATDVETLIAKVHFVGRNDLLYKKIRIGNNERTSGVLKTVLEKFNLDPSTYERYCIEQQLPNKRIVLLDHCNVFYALVRQSNDDQVELLIREKTRQESEQNKIRIQPPTNGHHRTPSGFSISSNHSR